VTVFLHQAPYQPQHRLPSLASYFIPPHRKTVILSLSHAQHGNQFVSQSHPQGVSNNGSAGRWSSSLVLTSSEGSETPQPHHLVESGKGCAGRLGTWTSRRCCAFTRVFCGFKYSTSALIVTYLFVGFVLLHFSSSLLPPLIYRILLRPTTTTATWTTHPYRMMRLSSAQIRCNTTGRAIARATGCVWVRMIVDASRRFGQV
jgi:hypothetical protein